MQGESLVSAPVLGVNQPYPLTDLDKICEIVSLTYDHITKEYTEKHFKDFVLSGSLETFAQILKERNLRHVLDIGCGPGAEVGFLLARGFEVVGIDASSEMLEMARSRVRRGDFRQMKMQALQFSEATFDAIWSARTLIHVPKALILDLLAAWKYVLKPGGILGVSVIIGDRDGWGPEDYAPQWPMYNRYFAEHELERALQGAGYSILKSQVVNDERDPNNPRNLFVFAEVPETGVDRDTYYQYVHFDKEENQWKVAPEDLESVIEVLLRAGRLSPRERTNLCVMYDQLAWRDRKEKDKYQLAAQKLKLHLPTPKTMKTDDFHVWFALGRLHLKLTQFQQGVDCLERARELRPDHFATLARLGYCYEGLLKFDEAIDVAHGAERLAENRHVSDEEMADLYHALGHFYVGGSYIGRDEISIADRDKGEQYMQRACTTGEKGYGYLSCLGGIYTETKRYVEAIELFERAIADERIRNDPVLYNELHFYRGEAYMGAERYDEALADFRHVETYARAHRDWDALAHVKLYQIRTELKRKDVAELDVDDLQSYLNELYKHEPSLYVVESFRRDRERMISILSAFYFLKRCADDSQLSDQDFERYLENAIAHLSNLYEEGHSPDLDLLVLSDDPAVPRLSEWYEIPYLNIHLFSFEEVAEDPEKLKIESYPVWSILASGKEVESSVITSLTYIMGRFYHDGYTIYVYDPGTVFPPYIRQSAASFFVDTIADLGKFSYASLLYEKALEYISNPKTPLGMAPIGVAPSRLAAQAEDIRLLSLERESNHS